MVGILVSSIGHEKYQSKEDWIWLDEAQIHPMRMRAVAGQKRTFNIHVLMKLHLSFRRFIFILVAIYFVWVAVPPFPSPKSIEGHTHSYIHEKLGSPDTEFPDKFNRWKMKRGFFEWQFETDSPVPLSVAAPVQKVAVRLIFVNPVASIPIYTDAVTIREL